MDILDCVKLPAEVAFATIVAGNSKLDSVPRELLVRCAIAGDILGISTSLAFSGALSTGRPSVGAVNFGDGDKNSNDPSQTWAGRGLRPRKSSLVQRAA